MRRKLRSGWVIALAVLLLGFSTSFAAVSNRGADFVFSAYEILNKNFYDPTSLNRAKLLDGSLRGMAVYLDYYGFKFAPEELFSRSWSGKIVPTFSDAELKQK